MTPFGHSLAGCAVYNFAVGAKDRNRLNLIFLCIFMATAADLDFLPGILIGRPALYHHGITHSLGFTLMASLVVAGIYRFRGASFSAIFNLCFFSYLSHLVIDFFGHSNPYRHPPGIPLFWPITKENFVSPVQLFLGVHHEGSPSASTLEWIKSMIDPYNVAAIALEMVLIMPFIFLGQLYRKRYGRGDSTV
jgi:inner membrane protein